MYLHPYLSSTSINRGDGEEKNKKEEEKKWSEEKSKCPQILSSSQDPALKNRRSIQEVHSATEEKPSFDPRRSPRTLGETLLEDQPLQRKIKIQGPEKARAKLLKFFIKFKLKATFAPRSSWKALEETFLEGQTSSKGDRRPNPATI